MFNSWNGSSCWVEMKCMVVIWNRRIYQCVIYELGRICMLFDCFADTFNALSGCEMCGAHDKDTFGLFEIGLH